MTQTQIRLLGLVTLAAVLVALWLMLGKTSSGPEAELRGRALLPDLSERINETATIRIEGAETSVTLIREGTTWRIEETGGYRADGSKVGNLLAGLLDATIEQVKTDNAALYERIGLGEEATRLVLLDGEDETIAALDAGKRQYSGSEFLSFVRPGDEARTYLVDSLPELRAEATGWLAETLLEIVRPRLAEVDITHRDGERMVLRRAEADAEFELVGMREDERYIGYRPAGTLATAYSTLRIDDVRPAGEIDLGEPRATATVSTFDGLSVRIKLFETGDETGDAWAALEASYSMPSGEEGPEQMPDAPADGEAEAAEIRERTEGWVFRLPSSKVGALTRRREELVEPVPAEEGAGEDGGGP